MNKDKEIKDVSEKMFKASKCAVEDYTRFSKHRTIGERLSYCATMEAICRFYRENTAKDEDPKGQLVNPLYNFMLKSVKANLEGGMNK